ncbi:MAG: cbb3-type cytochrome c oxidase subunit 3 [Xanthomonadaceae bacterium]|nr:cbb3-type cytochrome c oxidase subunit 3 [Xanthomonadaceae bacterium]
MTPISPIWGYVTGGIILLMMFTFIGIWIWAWRKPRKQVFNRMAHLPLEDEPGTNVDVKEDRP